MTGWHLWYTVRKLIRYCLKVREDNPNDLVAEIARTESEDFFASRRIAFQNRKEIFPSDDCDDKYVKNNGSRAIDLWGERAVP